MASKLGCGILKQVNEIQSERAREVLKMASASTLLLRPLQPKHPLCSFNSRSRQRPHAVVTLQRSSLAMEVRSTLALQPDSSTQENKVSGFDMFACPVCYEPLIRKGPPGLNLAALYRSGFKCKQCKKSFSSRDLYLDLTVTSGTKEYSELKPTRTELFRSPLVSFLYERGWRQNFNIAGFPGTEEEFKMAQEYFKPAKGGFLVDVSCGSGLFSRKFAKSGSYSVVIALDYSENMLRQCYDFVRKDENSTNINLALVRADVSRLPFPIGSVDAVHAGAALHCWPSASNAVAEISRILRSGGVFVGSTFLANPFGRSFPSRILRPFRQTQLSNSTYNNLTEEEIEDLCKSCGLIHYSSNVKQSFIIFSAQKP